MIEQLSPYLVGLPPFLSYLGLSLLVVAVFGVVYFLITPHKEFTLIREGNVSAAVAFLGAILGFIIPVVVAMRFGVNYKDFLIWAGVAGVVQIFAYVIARVMMYDLSGRITLNEIGAGVWLGGVSVLLGILNAASMTP